jgi:hypothetical protein
VERTTQPHLPVPDFSSELDQFHEILQRHERTDEWDLECANWVRDFQNRLKVANPQFDPSEFFELMAPFAFLYMKSVLEES